MLIFEMGIRREEVISHPFSEDFSSDGSSSSEGEFDVSSHDSDSISSSNMCSSDSANCVVHQVSKLDTLPGLAIKYGVEIADIKRMNNLVSDLQMFAHKSLVIPASGSHPRLPLHSSSTNSMNRKLAPKAFAKKPNSGSEYYSPKCKSTIHKTSSAMSSLQKYYGLLPHNKLDPLREQCKLDPLREQCTEMAFFDETLWRSKKSETDLPVDDSTTTPELGESARFLMRNAASESSLTHPLLVNRFNLVRGSASASGLRLRF